MDADPNSQKNAQQCPAKSKVNNEQHVYRAQVSPDPVPQQEFPRAPVLLHWPTTYLPINCTPVALSPQVISFSWDPRQPVTIPCLFSNVILQPCINITLPVLPAQVLVSSICFQGSPDTASPSPVISTELPDASNHGREDNQLPNAPNPVPEVYTETPDVSNQGTSSFEVDRQKVLDAAEALLILHNSPQASQETGNTPGLDGE